MLPTNRAIPELASIVAAVSLLGIVSVPVPAGQAEQAEVAAARSDTPPETLEDLVERLKKAIGTDVTLSGATAGRPFAGRREICIKSEHWLHLVQSFSVIPASPTDKIGEAPPDFLGAAAVRVIATDGRYTVVAGWNYDPEIAIKILAVLGQNLSKEAETNRLRYCAADWLDFRLAVAKDSGSIHQTPKPLSRGPTAQQIDDYMNLFAEKGSSAGRNRGDPYYWFSTLDYCKVSPLLVTRNESDFLALTLPKGSRGASYVLLSDKPDEVLLSGSQRPRPWYLKRVEITRDAQGRPAVELELDAVAAARMAKLTKANQGRALAVVFDYWVVQVQVIDGKLADKVVISGKEFTETLVAGFARSLRECMMQPAGTSNASNFK